MVRFSRMRFRDDSDQILRADIYFYLPPETSRPKDELVREDANRLRSTLHAIPTWIAVYPPEEELWINLRQVSTASYYPTARSAADDESDPEEYPSLNLWIGDQCMPDIHGADARRVYEAIQQFTMGGGVP